MINHTLADFERVYQVNGKSLYKAVLDTEEVEDVIEVQLIYLDNVVTLTENKPLENLIKDIASVETAAFSYTDNELYIVCNDSIFLYDQSTKVVFVYYRNPEPIKTLDDYLDIDEKHLEYFIALAIEQFALLQNSSMPSYYRKILNENRKISDGIN